MNTKNENVQEALDLQVNDADTIKKKTPKKAVKTSNKDKDKKTATKAKGTKKKENDAAEKKVGTKASTSKPSADKKVKAAKAKVNTQKKADTKNQDVDKSKTTKAKTSAKKAPAKKSEAGKAEGKKKAVKSKATKGAEQVDKAVEAVEISELENTNSNAKEPIVEDVKRHKLFFVSDMDEEAVYLHEMSLQGYHFLTKKGMQYTFRQGEVKNYFYHLGYYEKDKRDGERYLDNYTEAGWENIFHEKAEFDGVWNYFRIEMPIGESEPNIFSDRVSRLALYKRLLSSWRTLLAVDIICFFFTIFIYVFLTNHPTNMTNIYKTLCAVLDVIIVFIFAIYFRAYLKINHKQRELENI